ncbi:MAG: PAS domain-containing protein [Firmicutes bacterium]|nr:PAS domain-containing protein [Bacillota bacterium]
MKIPKYSLEIRIPVFMVVLVIIVISITGALSLHIATKNMKKEALSKNFLISRIISERIYQYLSDATETVVTAANFSSQSHGDLEQIKREIFRIYDNFSYFDLIFYTNSEARMLFSKPSNDHVRDRRYYDRDYFNEVMKTGKPFISRLIVSSVLGKPHFIIAAPVFDRNGKVQGLIGGGIPLESISNIVEEIQKDFSGKIWITDREGVIAVHPDKEQVWKLITAPDILLNFESTAKSLTDIIRSRDENIGYYKKDDEIIYAAISFVPEVNWMVMVEQSERDIFAQMNKLKQQLMGYILIIIVISTISSLFLAKSITNPIKELVTSVRKTGKDISNFKGIPVMGSDEIGELSKAFNDMGFRLKIHVNQLKDSYQKVNEVQQYLNNIIESVASGILVMDRNGTITVFNKAAEKITRFKSDEFLGKNIMDFYTATEFGADILREKGKICRYQETKLITKDNEEIPISVSTSLIKNSRDEIIGTIFLFNDLSQIKMLEDELKREDRIRTMGEMAANIIHEIGNPLAGISNLLQVLKENYAEDEIREEVLNTLEEEVGNLNKMVINFLDFSKTSSLNPKSTDIVELIDDILYLLKADIIAKKIRIKKEVGREILKVFIDERTIKQCFLNILINAVQAVKEYGEIELKYKTKNEPVDGQEKKFVEILVRDNGTGIQPDKIEKIFSPFFTTKKGGTGLGLAIAYKLIKENGGRIAVKSEVGKGTEFSILLPAS